MKKLTDYLGSARQLRLHGLTTHCVDGVDYLVDLKQVFMIGLRIEAAWRSSIHILVILLIIWLKCRYARQDNQRTLERNM